MIFVFTIMYSGNKNSNTFRPKKSHGGKRKELHKLAKGKSLT